MASGIVQEFHVEQITLGEAMAMTIAGEQPDSARRVAELLGGYRAGRADPAGSRDIITQIGIAERLILALWLIRFEGDTL